MASRSFKLVEYGQPFRMFAEEVPTAPRGGAVVKLEYAGVCHSDVHVIDGEYASSVTLPVAVGHEMSGSVYDIDSTADADVKIGDRVAVYDVRGCGMCSRCHADDAFLCLNGQLHMLGTTQDGGFADYVVVPDAKHLVKVPDTVAMDTASVLTCAGLTAYNTMSKVLPVVREFAEHTAHCAVLVVGAGGVGLWCVKIAKILFPPTVRVVVADVDPGKLSLAKESGCDEIVLWGNGVDEETLVKATKDACGVLRGAVVAIDLVNVPDTFARVEETLAQGGVHVMVGLLGGDATGAIPLIGFLKTRHSLLSIRMGSLSQLKEVMALVAKEKVKPPLITHHPLESAYDVMQDLKAGKVKGRAVVKL